MKKQTSIFEDQKAVDSILNVKKPESIWDYLPYRTYNLNGKMVRKHAPIVYEQKIQHVDGEKIETKKTPMEKKDERDIKSFAKKYSKRKLKSVFQKLKDKKKLSGK